MKSAFKFYQQILSIHLRTSWRMYRFDNT